MTYKEALQYKKESVSSADESVLKLYHILVAPADKEESVNFLDHFLKHHDECNDETCKEFSSSDNYEVVTVRKDN